ncbi:MAG TPA: branched-chain amino acid ABC transporter permease [Acidimicrobiales bacterium]|nr:branched-chain amino acid ABC transporter permease [Acidimicrobiales bacterium]
MTSPTSHTAPTETPATIPDGKEGVVGLLIDKKGTLNTKDYEPIEGVHVQVQDTSGNKVGSAVSDKQGRFAIELPGPGTYTAIIDPSTLKGATLADADAKVTFTLNPTQVQRINFRIGVVKPPTVSLAHKLGQAAVNGINFGLIIALASVGLSLIYGTTRLVNFAHGEIVTLGALLAFYFNNTLGWSLLVGAPIALLLTAMFGAGLDLGLWGPLRKRGSGLISMLVISIGLSLALKNLYLYLFGGLPRAYSDFNIQKAYQVAGIDIAPRNLAASIISVIALVGVAIGLQRTRMGKAMRAIADNRDLASSSGINVDRVIRFVWFFGSGLAALGGIFFGLTESAVSFEEGSALSLFGIMSTI